MSKNFDIIIIGAGPAGSTAAEELSKAGFKTLIIEKQAIPRDKPCAGIAPPRLYQLLGNIPEDVIDRKFNGYHLFSPAGIELYSRFLKEGVILDRKKFDSLLTTRAKDAGAEVIDNLKVNNVVFSKNKIKVNNKFHSEILIGADGANSFVRKCLGREYKKFALGVQYTIELPDKIIDEKIGNWFEVHYGIVGWGYGWVSPQGGKIKIGIGSTDDKFKRNAREYLDNFVEVFKKKKEIKNLKIINFESHPIPFNGPMDKPCKGNTILIGDAAGFVNPLTGEGIYYAVRSAQIAADSIIDIARDKNLETVCTAKLGKIKLNTKLRDEILMDNESMENYIWRLKKLGK